MCRPPSKRVEDFAFSRWAISLPAKLEIGKILDMMKHIPGWESKSRITAHVILRQN